MNNRVLTAVMAATCLLSAGCKGEGKADDRTQAEEMYARICELTKTYTSRLETAPDSTDWAAECSEFEEKLDKISFSYPPDTDLLLTEGQNDTIYVLMQEYAKVRNRRVRGLRYPDAEADTLAVADSVSEAGAADVGESTGG